MPQLIIQPSAGKVARDHLAETILRPVPLADIAPYLTNEQFHTLELLYPSGAAPIWGVTPPNEAKWRRIGPGDIALFSATGRFDLSGFVTNAIHNAQLARHLWGQLDDDQTWEYTYFLDKLQKKDIPYSQFNAALGYHSAFVPQGFMVISSRGAEKYLALLEPQRGGAVAHEVAETLLDAHAPVDRFGMATFRNEQSALRDRLLGGAPNAICGICARTFPADLLVAGHIKPRSICSDVEKRDPHVAMLVCTLGCDALFEHGYVGVVDGQVVIHSRPDSMPDLREILLALSGRRCQYWGAPNSGYFGWHHRHWLKTKTG